MIEESMLGELKNSFILSVNYHEDYVNYEAELMVPLFKHDTEPYILKVINADFPDHTIDIDSQHLDRLINSGKLRFINRLTHESHSPYTDVNYVTKDEITPFYNRVPDESKETVSHYINTFCQYILKPRISKRLPLNVYFDENNSSINFLIPFLDTIPAIYITTVLHNWQTTEEFVENVTQSLIKNFIPSKNQNLFS